MPQKLITLAPLGTDAVVANEDMVVLRAVVSTVVGMQGMSWLRRLPMVVVCLALRLGWTEVRGVPFHVVSCFLDGTV